MRKRFIMLVPKNLSILSKKKFLQKLCFFSLSGMLANSDQTVVFSELGTSQGNTIGGSITVPWTSCLMLD